MKKTLLTYSLFLFTCGSFSQELSNGQLNSNCVGNGFTAPSCVSSWFASHGNPFVQGTIPKNTWAKLTTNEEGLEGIFTHYEFIPGKKYQVSFKVKITTTIGAVDKILTSANVKAVTDLTSNFNTKNPISPNDSEIIWTKNITQNSKDWESVSITFTPQKSNSQLWFYTSITSGKSIPINKYSQFEIDDISITTSGQKSTTIAEKKENTVATTNSYRALEYIFPENVSKNDFLNIRINSGEISDIKITDLAGNTFTSEFKVLSKNYITFQLRKELYEGTYVVKATKKDGTIITKNITIK